MRVEQGDVDLAKQAVRSIQTAMVRLRAAVASGALSHVAAIAGAAGHSLLMSSMDGSKGPVGDEEAEEAEKARKLSELTRNMLPNDWRCGACKYVNSFSDGPCGWCGKNKTVATGTGMWDPFKGKRKRHAQQHAQHAHHQHMQHQMMDMPVGAGPGAVNAAMAAAVAQNSKGAAKVPRRMGPGQSMQQAVTTVGAPRAVVNVTTTPAVVQPASAAGAMGQKPKKKAGQLDVATA